MKKYFAILLLALTFVITLFLNQNIIYAQMSKPLPTTYEETKPQIRKGNALLKVNFKLPKGELSGKKGLSFWLYVNISNSKKDNMWNGQYLFLKSGLNSYTAYIPVITTGGKAVCKLYYEAIEAPSFLTGYLTEQGTDLANTDYSIEVKEGNVREISINAIKGMSVSGNVEIPSGMKISNKDYMNLSFIEDANNGKNYNTSLYLQPSVKDSKIQFNVILPFEKDLKVWISCESLFGRYQILYGNLNIKRTNANTSDFKYSIKIKKPEKVHFADAGFETAVREVLNMPRGDILDYMLNGVTYLEIDGAKVKDLSDLTKTPCIQSLQISSFPNLNEYIRCITPLNKINSLSIYDSQISDLSFLSSFTTLESLSLCKNNINDIKIIGNLQNLKALYLHDNKIEDISILKVLPSLESLDIGGNKLSDLSVLPSLKALKSLYLIGNFNVTDYSPVRQILNSLTDKDFEIDKLQVITNKLNQVITEIIKPEMTDYEKELAVHDYMVSHTAYDFDNFLKDTIPQESYEAYGILIKGTGVCSGYADTFKLFMDRLGIECQVVSGTANGVGGWGGHAWNIVKIQGNYYQVDTTWDDPVPDESGRVLYTYFNVTDEYMRITHKWEEKLYPRCTAIKYNYKYYTFCKKNNINIDSQSSISGIVSLPTGEIAPKGGLDVRVYANTSNGTIKDYKDDYTSEFYVNIPEGSNSVNYNVNVPQTSSGYSLYYTIDSDYGKYITRGYYNKEGTVTNSNKKTLICSENNPGINLSILKGIDIKGTVTLSNGNVAPKDGLNITIQVQTENGTPGDYTDDFSNYVYIEIPEGKGSVDYKVIVIPSKSGYSLNYSIYGDDQTYMENGYYGNGGISANYSNDFIIYPMDNNVINIPILKK